MDRTAYEHDYYFQNWCHANNRGKLREPFAPEVGRAPQVLLVESAC
jgi:DNA topoisomerase 2-associated protein PAT1